MSETYSSPESNSDDTSEMDLFEWLKQHQQAPASEMDMNQAALLAQLAHLHEDKSAITNSLQNIAISPPGSNLHEIGVAIIDTRAEKIPQSISDCLNHYFAINSDHEDRLTFTQELLDSFSRDALNSAGLPLEYDEPSHSIDIRSVYEDNQLDISFIMKVQSYIEGEVLGFADSVAEHYDI